MSKNKKPQWPTATEDESAHPQNSSSPNHKPVRPVIRRSPHRNVGVITLPWFQPEPIEWESQLERSCIHALIALWAVTKISHQPYRIPMPSDGKEKHYVPDFAVTLIDGSEIVIEVKPSKFIKKNEERFRIAGAWLRAHDIQFVVLTEKQLRHRAWSHIVPMFLRYARWDPLPDLRATVRQRLQDAGGESSFGELWDHINPNTKIPVYYLIGRREIRCDPREWYDDASRISLIDPMTIKSITKGGQDESKGSQNATDLFFQWFDTAPWGAHSSVQTSD